MVWISSRTRGRSRFVSERCRVVRCGLLGALAFVFGTQVVVSSDWPTYMHDNMRSGVTVEQLDVLTLREAWVYRSPAPPRTAWAGPAPWDAYDLKTPLPALRNFDDAFFVTVVGDDVTFGSSVDECVHCLSATTGQRKWFFRTEGPVRFPPTHHDGRLYVGSDDGCAYCLTTNGAQSWCRHDTTRQRAGLRWS